MMACDNCGGLIGEAGTMISGRVCQCRVQMTSATSDTSDRTIIHSLSETVLRLTARLAEVEKERATWEENFKLLNAAYDKETEENVKLHDELLAAKAVVEAAEDFIKSPHVGTRDTMDMYEAIKAYRTTRASEEKK